MYPRLLSAKVREALLDTPVVTISGPRQSGKTTLVRQFVSRGRQYVNLDDLTVLSAAKADPAGFIRGLDGAVIDEVQRAPELLLPIKQAVDDKRRPGRFLLTGSADIFATPRVAESLAGRVEMLELLPLSAAELRRTRRPTFLDRAFEGKAAAGNVKGSAARMEAVLAGGFPAALTRRNVHRRRAWHRAYLRSLVEKDIRDVAMLDKLGRFPRLIAVAAALSAQLVNLSDIARQVQLDYKTVDHYLAVLERLYVLRRIAPWHRNELKRLVKAPKLHFIDAGLLGAVRGIGTGGLALDRSRFGPVLESYVYSELLKLGTVDDDGLSLFHYRDKDQVEVDFVVENAAGDLIGVEVKAATSVGTSDFRGLARLRLVAGEQFRQGVVLYMGDRALSFGDRLVAVPLSSLGR